MDWKTRLQSRTFWMCVAAFLASVATSIAGYNIDNASVVGIGIVCGILSTAIFAAADATKDAAYAKANSNQKVEQTNKTASVTSTDKDTVKTVMTPVTSTNADVTSTKETGGTE